MFYETSHLTHQFTNIPFYIHIISQNVNLATTMSTPRDILTGDTLESPLPSLLHCKSDRFTWISDLLGNHIEEILWKKKKMKLLFLRGAGVNQYKIFTLLGHSRKNTPSFFLNSFWDFSFFFTMTPHISFINSWHTVS